MRDEKKAPHPVILCVEDEDDLRLDLVDELKEAGYTVIEARDGVQAQARIAAARPDLILCDINMPGCNGYDLLDELRRKRPELAEVPFIFLTALADPREVVRGKRAGADDYLVKPVDFDLMLATVEARLREVSRIRSAQQEQIDTLRQVLGGLHTASASQGGAWQALDYVALGMVLLDGAGQILFVNRSAREHAAGPDGFTLRGRFTASTPANARALHEAVTAAIRAGLAGKEHVSCAALARVHDARDLLVVACALDATGLQSPPAPAAVVFISDPLRPRHVPSEILASLFGLTPAECQVAVRLAQGRRLEEIAAQLDVSQTTIAYHMRNLYQKTGTNRQADLIALVLTGPMAVSFE
ncbi:MAG TPA: response regulator transcription factor [Paracoccus sp.]|nr:response regulator transcription factor [Paracoccus sp. (in: a-proteobacteria)]